MKRTLVSLLFLAGCGSESTQPMRPDASMIDGGSQPTIDGGDVTPDGGGMACGLPGNGTQCASSTELQHCSGASVTTTDCSLTGAYCGPDPREVGGFACVVKGGSCGRLTIEGECAGNVVAWCSGEELVVENCEEQYGQCGLVSPSYGYGCLTPCVTADAEAGGKCQGASSIRRCEYHDGVYQVVTHNCAEGTTCQTDFETGWPTCLPEPACSTVGPKGACQGDMLILCQGGSPAPTDCAASGQVCAYGGDEAGYRCAETGGGAGALLVSGTVRYEKRSPEVDGLEGVDAKLSPATPHIARGVAVAVVDDASGEVLAGAITSDDGTYMLRYDATVGDMVHVLAATTSTVAARPIRVLRNDALVHGFGSPSFAAAASTSQDILVSDFSGESEAFNVFDDLVTGMDKLRSVFGVAAPQPLFAQWERGSTDGTYTFANGIFLFGGLISPEVGDDDGYDDAVILHEFGHYLVDYYGQHDSAAAGGHDGSPTDPRLAFEEGFATYWSSVVRNDTYYYDTDGFGGWAYDLDGTVTKADPSMPMTQEISENTVSEILWDVGDGGGGDDDSIAGGHEKVVTVESQYLTTNFSNRGFRGIDLVDWLDGWFLLNGLDGCAPVKGIVGARDFPYDFNGPAGACP